MALHGSASSGGGGSGTVTSVSVTTANGVSGSVATATTTPAITVTLGAITPSSVAASGAVTGSNLSGTNTGDQTTVSGQAGSVANAVTFDNSGSGAASGTTFNGSAARTVSTNTIGALKASSNLSDVASLNTTARNLQGVYVLGQAAVPLIIVSSGTMGNNGALSGVSAVSATHANAFVYLPANAISAGSTAGFYYAVFSSTTAATVYNNTYTSGSPTPPGSPTAFATTGPGAFTQAITEIVVATVTIPAGAIGANGRVELSNASFTYPSSANAKTLKLKLAGTQVWSSVPTTTTAFLISRLTVTNRGITGAQRLDSFHINSGGTALVTGTPAIDTSASVDVTITAQLAVATETIALESWQLNLSPKA